VTILCGCGGSHSSKAGTGLAGGAFYPEYLPSEELKAGLLTGKYHKGTFKVYGEFWQDASVNGM